MNKWSIEVRMKSSRTTLHCCYKGPENDSTDVLNTILPMDNPVQFIVLLDILEKRQLVIQVNEIAFMEIYPFVKEK